MEMVSQVIKTTWFLTLCRSLILLFAFSSFIYIKKNLALAFNELWYSR